MRGKLVAFGLFLAVAPLLTAQQQYLPVELDPTADIKSPQLESSLHRPLPEQYIWAGGTRESDWDMVLYFRRAFRLGSAPALATLYVAGPDRIQVFLNGRMLANADRDPTSKIGPFLVSVSVSHRLKAGPNLLALKVSHGEHLVVKIVPAASGLVAPALLASGPGWKYSLSGPAGWEQPGWNDSGWKQAEASGSIEGNIENFQWNGDAGMYRWPGYDGISPFLAHLPLKAEELNYGFEAMGKFANVTALIEPHPLPIAIESAIRNRRRREGRLARSQPARPKEPEPPYAAEFAVTLPVAKVPPTEDPYLVLDFGRESDGRLEVISDSAAPMKIEVQYGESLEEALREPYLGADEIDVPPRSTAYGPKSAFRYAVVRFLEGVSPLRFKAIRLDTLYYPVHYLGSFESSDPLLDRIWKVGAYTSRLCMQDGIWDAPKRDRGRWMGDLDVSGRVIDTVFANRFLMQETLDKLVHDAGNPVHDEVNGIPGYSAFWVMGEADYYRHLGDAAYLHSLHDPLVRLLSYMETELNDQNLFANTQKHWPFVDWSPDLNGDTAEARRATQLEFYKAFTQGAWLLSEMGDAASAARFKAKAEAMKQAAIKDLLDPATNTFGQRWQTNAMAIFSGVADAALAQSIWENVLSHDRHFMITPYYNFYVITAMAEAGHRKEALDWIREYWGGMIQRGATSFWEAYDPTWPKENFHAALQADNGQGYFVSLSHGWSSGPTAWLTEQVLGIQPQAGGFSKVLIRPDLAGLTWARGAEPTPHGPIKVDYRAATDFEATIELPDGVDAQVSVPVSRGTTAIEVNGQQTSGTSAEDGVRLVIHLDRAGTYKLRGQ